MDRPRAPIRIDDALAERIEAEGVIYPLRPCEDSIQIPDSWHQKPEPSNTADSFGK